MTAENDDLVKRLRSEAAAYRRPVTDLYPEESNAGTADLLDEAADRLAAQGEPVTACRERAEAADTRVAELEAAAPNGWKLVPVEPTEAMKVAVAHLDWTSDSDPTWIDGYRAMLSAAPAPPSARSYEDGERDAVAIIRDHRIDSTSTGQVLAPRHEGDRMGLAYAEAIETLTGETSK